MKRLVLPRRARLPLTALIGLWVAWRVLRAAVGAPELDTHWAESTRVLAKDGRVLGERGSALALRGRFVRLADVSPRLVRATVVSEDKSFARHDGIDFLALVRAFFTNLAHGSVISGGSTLTAQLVKRLDHHGAAHDRSLLVKLRELARAQNLETRVSKDVILEAYLNLLDYGHGLVGPEAAAQAYFGVSARDLSLAQAALLAVLPRAPSALDPYRHRGRAVARQRALLGAMCGAGEIGVDDRDRALGEELVLQPSPRGRKLVSPHLVLAAAKGGGEIRTTLDFDVQRDVEVLVQDYVPTLRERSATNAAVLVVDNASGEVVGEVGSAGYFDRDIAGAVDLVRRRRQPGSTLKPFLYARAFEKGMTPTTVLADVPTELGTTGAVYAPDNFDGSFAGPVAAREALAASLNVPAVRVARDLGTSEVVRVLRAAGLSLAGGAERFGLSIALGSAEVSPWELATAYVTLARGGERIAVHDRPEPAATARIFTPAAAAEIAEILSDPVARVRGIRARSTLEFPYPVALKTGTSTGYRDAWTAGYTRERTVIVWVGNADGKPTQKVTGASGASPLFVEVMKRVMRDVARGPLFDAALLEEREVCPLSGELVTDDCPDRVARRFAKGQLPEHACTMHRHGARRNAAAGEAPLRCTPHGDVALVTLPEEYARFLAERPPGAPGLDAHGTPWFLASRVPGCTTTELAEPARIVVVEPRDGHVYALDAERSAQHDTLRVVVETHGLPRDLPLEVVVDGVLVGPLARGGALLAASAGEHDLEVRPRDPHLAAQLGRARFTAR